ncbi:hypothetical protein [Nicoliella lavandulae]|uniref:Uncharacterized protein n=1 Tax=Nicoliella lavandulae TaxID=3082954 RepID=A0ABU8SMD2_9LACO
MDAKQVYLLQFISDEYGPSDFVAINDIDRCVIIGDAVRTWRVPAIEAQIVEHHELIKAVLNGLKRGYRLVVASHHPIF